jgi:hypothetical protein
VGVGEAEEGFDPGAGVVAVVGEGLAGPVAGDQDAAPADAEGGLLVTRPLQLPGRSLPWAFLGCTP